MTRAIIEAIVGGLILAVLMGGFLVFAGVVE